MRQRKEVQRQTPKEWGRGPRTGRTGDTHRHADKGQSGTHGHGGRQKETGQKMERNGGGEVGRGPREGRLSGMGVDTQGAGAEPESHSHARGRRGRAISRAGVQGLGLGQSLGMAP